MVDKVAVALHRAFGNAHNMEDRQVLGIASGNTINGAQFANAIGSTDSGFTFDTGVTVCGICGVSSLQQPIQLKSESVQKASLTGKE